MGFPWFTWGGGCARLPDVPMGGGGGVLTAASHRSLCDGNKKILGHLPDHTGWSGKESVPPYQLFCLSGSGKRGVGIKRYRGRVFETYCWQCNRHPLGVQHHCVSCTGNNGGFLHWRGLPLQWFVRPNWWFQHTWRSRLDYHLDIVV